MNPLTFRIIVFTLLFGISGGKAMATDYFSESFPVKGVLLDKESNETLIGATVYVSEFKTGTATDLSGTFLLKLPAGNYTLQISYIGYKTRSEQIQVNGPISKTYYLERDTKRLEDVLITGERQNENITRTAMSMEKMKIKEIRRTL